MLRYLLDTNICIYIAKKHPDKVLKKLEHLNIGEVGMSVVTHGELFYGACKSNQSAKSIDLLTELSTFIPVLPVSDNVGEYYGKIRRQLEKQGTPVGNNDLWIAAHAMALNVTLVSNNLKEFTRIEGLALENWVE